METIYYEEKKKSSLLPAALIAGGVGLGVYLANQNNISIIPTPGQPVPQLNDLPVSDPGKVINASFSAPDQTSDHTIVSAPVYNSQISGFNDALALLDKHEYDFFIYPNKWEIGTYKAYSDGIYDTLGFVSNATKATQDKINIATEYSNGGHVTSDNIKYDILHESNHAMFPVVGDLSKIDAGLLAVRQSVVNGPYVYGHDSSGYYINSLYEEMSASLLADDLKDGGLNGTLARNEIGGGIYHDEVINFIDGLDQKFNIHISPDNLAMMMGKSVAENGNALHNFGQLMHDGLNVTNVGGGNPHHYDGYNVDPGQVEAYAKDFILHQTSFNHYYQ